jgi:hypothetical protein
MKALIGLVIACVALVGAGCSYHETVVEKRPATAAVVVPDSPPPATVVVRPAD